jgi:hypothetical protein
MSRVLTAVVIVIVGTLAWAMANALPFAGRADVIRILKTECFEIFRDVRKIPSENLRSAGVIPRGRSLSSALVAPDQPFDSSDAFVNASKLGQLILAGINKRYEIICFWQATHGGPVANLMIVQRAGRDSAVIFYGSLSGEPHSWADVKTLLIEGKISEFVSAAHPEPYKSPLNYR